MKHLISLRSKKSREQLYFGVKLCIKNEIKIVLIPQVVNSDEIDSYWYRTPFKEIAGSHSDMDVYYVDLFDTMLISDRSSIFVDSVHLTDKGYLMLAGQISLFLLEKEILN